MSYQSLCPIRLSREITENQNSAQINYTNNLFKVSLKSAGYNQKRQIENSIFAISTEFCDFKVKSYSKNFILKLTPKIPAIPVNAHLFYPSDSNIQKLSAKADYSFSHQFYENSKTKLINDVMCKVDTKCGSVDTEMVLKGVQNDIVVAASTNLRVRNNYDNKFFKFGITIGKPIFTLGVAYNTKHQSSFTQNFELAFKLNHSFITNHTKLSTKKLRTIFDFNRSPFSASVAFESKSDSNFGYLQLGYLQNLKSFQYVIDTDMASKLQVTIPVSERNTFTLSSTICKDPSISFSVNIDDTK